MKKNQHCMCSYIVAVAIFCTCYVPSLSFAEQQEGIHTGLSIKGDLILLPMPRNMEVMQGSYEIKPDRYICLSGGNRDSLQQTGLILQKALSSLGPQMELTLSRGTNEDAIGLICLVDSNLITHAEGYLLKISPEQIIIVAHDDAGAFYAAMTLRQICGQVKTKIDGKLPCLKIEDWPDFAHRGIMIDTGRGKVPTMETLRKLIENFSQWKINQLQIYLEHAFAYRNHKAVWEKASPYTAEDFIELDSLCRKNHIELVPCQNSFGHMERWLNLQPYTQLSENPDAASHFTFNPLDNGAIVLMSELYDELLPNFTSRQFNVCCDEAELGKGLSSQACKERGVGRVYLDYLLKIHSQVQSRGKSMQFWADIILNHPELIKELPSNVIAMVWGYEAQYPYAENAQKMRNAGIAFYVCPGVSSWGSPLGRIDVMMANLVNATENGLKNNAVGVLTCDWGDYIADWEYLPISMPGFAYSAALSWSVQSNRDINLPQVLDTYVFMDEAQVMGQLMLDLGQTYKETGAIYWDKSLLANLVYYQDAPLDSPNMQGATVEGFNKVIASIDSLLPRLDQAKMKNPDAQLILDEIRNNAAMAKHFARIGIARVESRSASVSTIPDSMKEKLAADIKPIIPELRRLWILRNRPGGLDQTAGVFESLLKTYNTPSSQVQKK